MSQQPSIENELSRPTRALRSSLILSACWMLSGSLTLNVKFNALKIKILQAGKCHLRAFLLARHPICATSIRATSHLRDSHSRDILFARHCNCATSHLRDNPVARHFNCAISHLRYASQLRDIPFARHFDAFSSIYRN